MLYTPQFNKPAGKLSPCFACPDKVPNCLCQSTCDIYKEHKAKKEAELDKYLKARDAMEYESDRGEKIKRRRRLKSR